MRTYGGFAKGIPKKLDKLPLVEPTKFFELRDGSISTERKPQEPMTNRIIQPNHRSLVAYNKSGASKGQGD
jgi:hypothetical protein